MVTGDLVPITFVRHGKAVHNEAFDVDGINAYHDPKYLDPKLTELGIQQALALADGIRDSYDLVIVSPLRRALETAVHVFGALKPVPKFVALEIARERIGQYPCDKRSTRTILASEFPQDDDDVLWTAERETVEHQQGRARVLLTYLHNLGKTCDRVAVVAHDSILRAVMAVLKDTPGAGLDMYSTKAFGNCEKRVYNIPSFDGVVLDDDGDDAIRKYPVSGVL